MPNTLYAVFGASGCGRGILPLLREQFGQDGVSAKDFVFIDDNCPLLEINGHRVLDWETFLSQPYSNKKVAIAIANSVIREKLFQRCLDANIEPVTVKAANIIEMDNVVLGQGALLSPFVTLTSNLSIGKAFHANLYSYVEHDCVIGDFVTFAPRVMCNGNIHIEDHVYVGAGAVIKQGLPNKPLVIGKGAVIGMGAVVTKSVPAGVTVVGNPARILKSK